MTEFTLTEMKGSIEEMSIRNVLKIWLKKKMSPAWGEKFVNKNLLALNALRISAKKRWNDLTSLHWKIVTNIFCYRIASVRGLVFPAIAI